jgi:hypothetical protein
MSTSQPETVDATFYAQVEPRWRPYGRDATGHPILDTAKVVALTQSKPERPRRGTVQVKLTLRLPAGAFLPLAPEAIIVIPADLVERGPVVVDATDPRSPEADL